MSRTRILPLLGMTVGALALAGCVISPPAVAPAQPQPSTPTTSQPSTDPTTAPESTDPAPSAEPEPSDAAPASGGSTVTIDGTDVGSWGGTLSCYAYGDGALVTSDSEDESGTLVGGADLVSGAWSVTGFLMTNGTDVYYQTDETAPATFEGGVLSASFGVTDFSGGSATVDFSVPC